MLSSFVSPDPAIWLGLARSARLTKQFDLSRYALAKASDSRSMEYLAESARFNFAQGDPKSKEIVLFLVVFVWDAHSQALQLLSYQHLNIPIPSDDKLRTLPPYDESKVPLTNLILLHARYFEDMGHVRSSFLALLTCLFQLGM